jgi:hypothetical protein
VTRAALLGAAAVTLHAAALAAQALPTLSDLGASWISPGGGVQLHAAGRLDAEFYAPADAPPWLIPGTDAFATGRLRLFGDLFLGEAWFVTAELRADGGEAPERGRAEARLEQLFVRWTRGAGLALQAGRFVAPLGSYPSRHHTTADPLIRPPLPYEYRTMVSAREVPANSGAFADWKDDPATFRPIGAPPIWGAPYPWGALAMGSWRALSYHAAIVNSAPSSEPAEWGLRANPFDRPTLMAGAGYQLAPWLRLDVHHSRGPYLESRVVGPMPAEAGVADFRQLIWGAELLYQLGSRSLRAEAFHDRWEVPNVPDDPIDVSWSVEAVQKLRAGWFIAARYGAIHFRPIALGGFGYDGPMVDGRAVWDYDATRLQLGTGYRLLRNVEARAEYAWNRSDAAGSPRADLLSLQLWWEF